MTNLEKMLQSDNKNIKLFAKTIIDLKLSKGFYGRLERDINDYNKELYNVMCKELEKQDFKDTLNVILWLEEE